MCLQTHTHTHTHTPTNTHTHTNSRTRMYMRTTHNGANLQNAGGKKGEGGRREWGRQAHFKRSFNMKLKEEAFILSKISIKG